MKIEIWSDFACPWCALGVYRLDRALARFEHSDRVTVTHRAFELDPRAPAERTQTMGEIVAAKYQMSAAQVEAGHEHLRTLGQEVGFEFDFGRVRLGSTFDAHRLTRSVRGRPQEADLVRGLFAAYFSEGRLLSDHEVLRGVAGAAGVDPALVAEVLSGTAYAAEVRADEREATESGIFGVPHFVINGAWAIPGAQDVDTVLAILQRAWARAESGAQR